jgi:hypothetical protein
MDRVLPLSGGRGDGAVNRAYGRLRIADVWFAIRRKFARAGVNLRGRPGRGPLVMRTFWSKSGTL